MPSGSTKVPQLERWLNDQGTRASSAERIPAEIKTFLDNFAGLDIRIQKAHLQTILKAAYVHRDGRIDVEFRGVAQRDLKGKRNMNDWFKALSARCPSKLSFR